MCFIWIVYRQDQERIPQTRYDRLMARVPKLCKRNSPPEYEQDLVVKVHQATAQAFKRPDSLTLPKYASYRSSGKRQRVENEKEVDKMEGNTVLVEE